ncbi:MAG: phosphate ABC transporter permease PstA [Thermoplasmata archaeon]
MIYIKWRIFVDTFVKYMGIAILAILMFILIAIVGSIIFNGAGFINIKILTENGNTSSGGIANAIIGTWLLVFVGIVISLPVGVLAAIFLSEYGNKKFGLISSIFTDILTSVPSIILGFFGYLLLVIYLGFGYSLLAGGITLGILMLPYVVRITELSLLQVTQDTKDAAYALGASKLQVIFRVSLPQSAKDVMAAVVLAVSIASGETAQLLYTAGWNNDLPTGLTNSQVGYLTYVVWTGINQPFTYAHILAYSAALVLILSIFGLIIFSKYIKRGF